MVVTEQWKNLVARKAEKRGEALREGVLIMGENKYTTFSNKGVGLQRDPG